MHAVARAVAVAIATAAATAAAAARPHQDAVRIEDLGAGVYAAVRTEPLGLAVNANSLIVVNDADVLIVDAQFTREATLETIRALRRITSKPVRWVVNTHWHDDHVAGNQVYADSFPGVRFLAHANTRADLVALGRPNRAGQVEFAPPAADRFERLLGMGLGADSTPVVPGERESLTSALRIIRRYVAESDGFREILPDTIAGARQTIRAGGRTIELRWFGRGNTRGDVVVHLPAEGIVATGDLLVAPIPFGFNSYPSEWIAVLDSVAALRPAVLVPGHGPVLRDLEYLHVVRRALVSARDETRAAAARGDSAAGVLRAVKLERARLELADTDAWLEKLFDRFFRTPVVQRLRDELTKGPLADECAAAEVRSRSRAERLLRTRLQCPKLLRSDMLAARTTRGNGGSDLTNRSEACGDVAGMDFGSWSGRTIPSPRSAAASRPARAGRRSPGRDGGSRCR